MKSEWTKVPIESVCHGIYDGPHATPAPSDSGAIFLGISNFSNGRLNFSDIRYISEEDLPKWTKRVTPRVHDIVFSYEATLNLYAIIPEGFRGCLGRRMALMRPDESKVDYRYLFYYMYSPTWRAEIEAHKVMGSTVDRIPLIYFPSFTIELPNMATQHRIADILSALDDKIELNQKINENLERQAGALVEEYFAKTNMSIELSNIMSFENGFAFQSKSYLLNGEYRIITIKNVQDGKIDSQGAACINILPDKLKAGCILNIGDVLLSLTGNVGRTGIVCEHNLLLNQRVAKIVPFDNTILPFLYFVFRHPFIKIKLEAIAKGTAQLNLSPIETLRLHIPFDVSSAQQISTLLRPMFLSIIKNIQENIVLSNIRDSLLPRLMTGEIAVDEVF